MGARLSKLHAIFGLLLIIAGFIFDFAFVTTTENFRESLRDQTASYSWMKYAYELTKFYLFVLGFLNIGFALLIPSSAVQKRMGWMIFGLLAGGSILFVSGGLWEAHIGPVYKWEPPCYVLGAGLFAILLSLVFEIYVLMRAESGHSEILGKD